MCYGILYLAIHRWWTTYLQTISYTSYEILSSGFLLMQYFVRLRLWHFGVTFGSRLSHFWYRSCAHSCRDRKSFTIFVLEILPKYQVTNWWLKNLLTWSNKEADFCPEINKSFTFPGMGQYLWIIFMGKVRLYKSKTIAKSPQKCHNYEEKRDFAKFHSWWLSRQCF